LRNDAINAAISDTGNIATILAGQFSRSLHTVDTVLQEIRKSTKGKDLETPEAFRAAYRQAEVHEMLKQHAAQLPHVFNVVIADASGQIVASTAAWPPPDINISDRDYFKDARMRKDGNLSTSVPINNRIDGRQTIVFARRLESANGGFAGIIFASVNSKYFEAIYESTQSIRSLIFNLVREDGTILFRHPDVAGVVGRKLSAEAAWNDAKTRGTRSFRILATADGKYRYVSVRDVSEYPLFVNISITESAALSAWFRRSAMILFGSVVFLLCSIYLLLAMTRQMRVLGASESSLKQKSQQLDAALNNMAQGLSMFDGNQKLVVANKQFAEMYRLSSEQLRPGTPLREVLEARAIGEAAPANADFVDRRIAQVHDAVDYSTVDHLRDGRIIAISHERMDNGGWVSIHQDITDQKRAEAVLAHMARHDALTGLGNRVLLLERASDAIDGLRRRDGNFSVLMLDLDRFKAVNDSLGHTIGDALLKAVADRLRTVVRDMDMVSRLGGDEFAIIQASEQNQRDDAATFASRIRKAVAEPYEIDGHKIVIGASIGIAMAPQDGADAESLIKNADLALYKAKGDGRNCYRFFNRAMEAVARDRRELEDDMRRALTHDEFELHYQTIFETSGRICRGVEALVRWQHPTRGLLSPGQFIPLAEESGLIIQLGEWILRAACAQAALWPSSLKVAVNLSPTQFTRGDLIHTIKSIVAETGLAPERLELEITETVLVEDNEKNIALLHDLKALGVSIVLDDFGTGYSSMRYLQMFPFDGIKIDRSFTKSMTTHSDSAAIVSAIVGLGRSLGIETTAEGVEAEEQLVLLRAAGCELAQGYLFSRPVPPQDVRFEASTRSSGDVRAA
jgi:diguanylate cyclase (GGDEF)-like protein